MKGKIRVLTDMAHVKQILLREGFHDVGILQKWKDGQIFGLVKPIGEKLEVHIRGHVDNTLDAEIKLSKFPLYLDNPIKISKTITLLIYIIMLFNSKVLLLMFRI